METPDRSRRRFLAAIAGGMTLPILGCSVDPPAARPTSSPNAAPRTTLAVRTMEGQGAIVQRVFPTPRATYLDPFVLLDDFSVAPPAGFPDHPHRGFEAFTYMLDGTFHHQDNLGHDSRIATGGVQLFTSGRGARHSEMPGEPRENRGLQLWVNLPRRLKTMAPAYAGIDGRDIPEEGARGVVRRTVVGPASPVALQTSMTYADLALEHAARFGDEIPAGWNALVYVISGHLKLGDLELGPGAAAFPSPGEIELAALEPARAVVLAGRPHGEPIYLHGPFVD